MTHKLKLLKCQRTDTPADYDYYDRCVIIYSCVIRSNYLNHTMDVPIILETSAGCFFSHQPAGVSCIFHIVQSVLYLHRHTLPVCCFACVGCDLPLELDRVKDCSVAGSLQGAPLQYMCHVNGLHEDSAGSRQHPNICWQSEFMS